MRGRLLTLWDEVLRRVEDKVNPHSFATWFRPTSALAEDGSRLVVNVPSAQFKDWISKNYQVVIGEALAELGRPEVEVTFECGARQEAPRAVTAERESLAPSSLNGKYTFDSFVVGASNQFAHAASRAVAEIPSKSYKDRKSVV